MGDKRIAEIIDLGFAIENWRMYRHLTARKSPGRRMLVTYAWRARRRKMKLLREVGEGVAPLV